MGFLTKKVTSKIAGKLKGTGTGKAIGGAVSGAKKTGAGQWLGRRVEGAKGLGKDASKSMEDEQAQAKADHDSGLLTEEQYAAKKAEIAGHQKNLKSFGIAGYAAGKFHAMFSSWLGPIIVFVVTIIFGGFLQFFFPLFLAIGLVIGFILVGLKAFPTLTKYIIAIGIIIILLVIPMSPLAKQYGIDYGSLSLTGKQSSKATAGVQTQLSATFSCILGGTNCELITNTYKSEQAQSDYTAQVSDVGVKVEHLGPARDFASNDIPEIQAIVNAKGFYKSPIGASISVNSTSTEKKISEFLTGGAWACSPSSINGNMIRNKFVLCAYNKGICVKEGDTFNMPVEVSVTASNTITSASKQFALTTSETMSAIEGDNMLEYFGFDSENFKSAQIGDESANLAIYATTGQDVLSGDFQNTIAIKLANPGTGKLTPTSIQVTMPAQFEKYIDKSKSSAFAELPANQNTITISISALRTSGAIETAKFKNWYLVFNDKLAGEIKGEVSVFSIFAVAMYSYADSQSLIVPITGAGTC